MKRSHWLLPLGGLLLGGAGGALAGLTSDMTAWAAAAGGTASGALGLLSGVAITAAQSRRAAAATRAQAVIRRDAAGDVLPLPRSVIGMDEKRPSWLLSPDQQIAPFRGRQVELDALRGWSAEPASPPVMVVSGPAGSGKTRLVIEFARRWAAGWIVLRVGDGRETGLVETLLACGQPTVVVVDLKHPREWLVALLEDADRTHGRVKVLVECRSEAWRNRVRNYLAEADARLVDAAARLEVLPFGGAGDLLRWLNEGTRAVSDAIGAEVPRAAIHGPVPGTSMLAVQARACFRALGGSIGAVAPGAGDGARSVRAEIGEHLFDHERRYWGTSAGAAGAWDDALSRRAVCLLTLIGAGDEDEAGRVLRRVPDLADANEERRRAVARWVRSLYPGQVQGEWIGQLEPDLLALALHATEFDDPAVAGRLTDPELTPREITRTLQALMPGLTTFPPLRPVAARVIEASQPLRAIPSAIATALYLDDPHRADRMLAEHIARQAADSLDLDALEPLLAGHLLYTGAALAQARVEQARRTQDPPKLAGALRDVAAALERVGRYAEALAAVEEGLALFRQLDRDEPTVYRGELAHAVRNLAAGLERVGRHAEALAADEEAVAL